MRLQRTLEKFVDPLPLLRTLKPKRKSKRKTYYEVAMKEFREKLHRDLPPTRLWGYEGMFPGPVIETNKDELVEVLWKNELPSRHFLPIDQTLHSVAGNPEVRTVVHLHGGATPPDSDGYPDAWFTNGFKQTGPDFREKCMNIRMNNVQVRFGITIMQLELRGSNVYAGLIGMYIIRDNEEESLNLPKADYEIPLIISDRSFNEDGSLFYPSQPDPPLEDGPNPSVVPFFWVTPF